MIRHAKETKVKKILMQFRKNVNYIAYISDNLIEICNTHTITLGYQTQFLSQLTFNLDSAWNDFDCLLLVDWPAVMMVNIGTRVAPVKNAVSSSKNAALIEVKMMQYTTLSIKYHHCTSSEIKNRTFTMSDVLACVSIHCADQKQHSIPNLLTKSIDNTPQTCLFVANDYV